MTFKLAIIAVTFVYCICVVFSVEHTTAHSLFWIDPRYVRSTPEMLKSVNRCPHHRSCVFLKCAALNQDKLEEFFVGIGQSVNQLRPTTLQEKYERETSTAKYFIK